MKLQAHKTLLITFISLSFFLSLLAYHSAYGLQVPPLKGYVNDYADMISPAVEKQLEKELKEFEKSDSTQIVILTIPSLEGEVLEDFSIRVAENWKIGQKNKDNGVILLVVKNDRKIRIEVGRGLEGRLTDLLCGRIIDLVIKPRFKRGDFDGGFLAAISSLIDATRGEFKSNEGQNKNPEQTYLPLFIFVTLFFWIILMKFLYRLSVFFAGLLGAIGLPLIIYLIGSSMGLIAILVLMLIGFFLGILLPRLPVSRGGYFYGSHSSSWHSSSFGGFSGGGGSFGGGGASGSW